MFNLRADFSRNLSCNYCVFVTFSYKPEFVTLIKTISKRFWHSDTKEWEIHQDCYQELLSIIRQHDIPYNVNEFKMSVDKLKRRVAESKEIKETPVEIDTSILDNVVFEKTQPRDYQKQGIAFGLTHDKFLLADEQGLGKTLQCLNIAQLVKTGKHCLIITGFDALQYNWFLEVKKHTNEEAYILGQRTTRKGKFKLGTMQDRMYDLEHIEDIDSYFIITSVVTLRHTKNHEVEYWDSRSGCTKTRKIRDYIFADKINELCRNKEIGRIIFDEVHVCKNYDTVQTTAMLKLTECNYKIAATGTPIMNRNIDLYPVMKWLDKENLNYFAFRNHYCIMGGFKNKEIKGDKNIDELHKRLSCFMLRRKKDSVLDLPEKIYIDEYLTMDLIQQKFYSKVKQLARARLKQCKNNRNEIFQLLLVLRKATCTPEWIDPSVTVSVKFDRTIQLVDEITQNNQKVLIFSNWATPLNMLFNMLKAYNPAMIHGERKTNRMEEVLKFQEDDSCKVLLGTYGAMGTGLTLTAASNVIHLDEPWNRAVKDQAIDRAHRIGTKNSVNIYTLMCKDTYDEKVHEKVESKGELFDKVIDGMSTKQLYEYAKEILSD